MAIALFCREMAYSTMESHSIQRYFKSRNGVQQGLAPSRGSRRSIPGKVVLIGLLALLIVGLSLGILGIRHFTLTFSQQTADDPLAAYEALRPGNSESALN